MKIIKKLGLFIFIVLFSVQLAGFYVSAENISAETIDELYKRQYEASGADELNSLLPKETTDILEDMTINPENIDEIGIPKGENIIKLLMNFFVDGIKNPLKTALSIIGILLIFASFEGIATENGNSLSTIFVCFVASLVATAPAFALMESVKTAAQTISNFMLGLVPVYTGIMISMGSTTSAGGFSTLLLGATEVISYLISYFFLPLSGAVLCLGICGGISPIPLALRLSGWIKKTSTWVMGIASTLFLSILSLQNTFSSASDGLTMRTSKAMLSTAIPVMGPAIAETMNTARGCIGMLKSGVGIYAVAAIAILALPVIIELILWRVSMWAAAGTAEIFGMKQVENLLRAVDFCFSVLLSSVGFITLLFIISLAIGTGAG